MSLSSAPSDCNVAKQKQTKSQYGKHLEMF